MQFKPAVITGPRNGFIALIHNDERSYEINAMGEDKHREFYSRKSAEDLAAGHAALVNGGFDPDSHSSFLRKM